jgi:hypothetical protein
MNVNGDDLALNPNPSVTIHSFCATKDMTWANQSWNLALNFIANNPRRRFGTTILLVEWRQFPQGRRHAITVLRSRFAIFLIGMILAKATIAI